MNKANKTIGEIVAEDYRTAKVFESHGIDFCCGGNIALRIICQEKEIDVALLIKELEAVKDEPVERNQDFSAWELSFLADYIVNVHHGYLKENMDKIDGYTSKIAEVHGSNHPEAVEIASIFSKIVANLKAHLREEEEEFFPALKRVETNKKTETKPTAEDVETIKESLKNLGKEHEEIGDAVHQIRRLSGGYTIPPDVCNTFALAYRKLEEFEDDLHKHVHLENNILFPKTVCC
jgi:regulator of cell morphogenesis and NO signaling